MNDGILGKMVKKRRHSLSIRKKKKIAADLIRKKKLEQFDTLRIRAQINCLTFLVMLDNKHTITAANNRNFSDS